MRPKGPHTWAAISPHSNSMSSLNISILATNAVMSGLMSAGEGVDSG